MPNQPLVEFVEIVKDYPQGLLGLSRLRAVDHVSFRIEPGEVVGLIGPNRAGKTTLVKLLLSLCQPTSGTVSRFGEPASSHQTLARVGYVHENQAFPRYLSARALLHYYGALAFLTEETVEARVPALLQRVGLADRSDEPIARFSKGMIQRLGIAQALLNEPDLLVFDEPSEGLDLIGRQLVRDLLQEQKKQGKSVLFVSHLLAEVEQLCDRVAVIVGGRLAFVGGVQQLCTDPATKETRTLEASLHRFYRPEMAFPSNM
jgi:ABC-2 type transport system ATP-binding protein